MRAYFAGDDRKLGQAVHRAFMHAHELEHLRVGSTGGPPLGTDAQASYQASLRLALARHEHQHRSEHLALTLVSIDPGVDWLLTHIGIDARELLADLAAVFPRRDAIHFSVPNGNSGIVSGTGS
ncbi:MAG: hypothetical protein ACYCO9_00170 [Streptosporangiaceae bacterium]